MKRISHKLKTFFECVAIFSSPFDILKYVYLKLTPIAFPKVVQIRLKESSIPLLCRPKTSDIGTLLSTFKIGYHRPQQKLPPNPVIFDLGANVGYTVTDLAIRYPGARIIAVEMDEENFRIASQNILPFGSRCTLLHAAVWTDDGEVSYEKEGRRDAFHISGTGEGGMNKVQSRSLRSIFKQFQIENIDYLKMDIEGAERNVMEKASEWAHQVRIMNIETHAPDLMDAIATELSRLGFTCEPSDSHWASVIATNNHPSGYSSDSQST